MKISVFKDLFKSKDVPHVVDLEKIINRIRVGKSKEIIEKIRGAETKDLKNALKAKLPSILFAGEFSQRNSNSLIQHSGLMVVDFDGYPSNEVMRDHLETLKTNKHFVLLFISPGGNGIKGVVKIPAEATKETHPKYFKAFQFAYKYEYFDISNSNVDRVCFESFDPEIYVNLKASVFAPELADNGHDRIERVPILPITDEDRVIEKIMRFNWNKGFNEGERNSFIYDLASAFCEYGVNLSTAIGYIVTNVIIGDFSEKEAETAIKSAYRSRQFNIKYFEDSNRIDRIKNDLREGKQSVIKKHKITEDVFDTISEEILHDDFWIVSIKGKISVIPLKYKMFLERNGFKKHFPNDSETPIFVQVISNKVEVTNVKRIKDFVLNYLIQQGEIDVWNYCASFSNLFSEQYLSMLDSIDLIMLNDEKDKSFIAFQNGILEITATEKKLIDYIDVNGYIWSSHILDREYTNIKDTTNDYSTFVNNISGSNPLPFETTIGYLLNTYKNRSQNKAVILNDEVISENPEGGTGKGLFVQGLGHIRKTATIDGKAFNSKSSFAYQTVSIDTKILVMDDVKRGYSFEDDFSIVTEGLTIERKGMDAIKLNVHDSPKLVISTNYAIKGEGHSHDRRRHELEFAQYYGKSITPESEFKRQLFNDWDLEDFQKFDNYMTDCIQKFLKHGLVKQEAKNIKLRKFIAETAMDFYDWISDSDNFTYNIRYNKEELFTKFTNDYPDYKKWLNRKVFNRWVNKYADFTGLQFEQGCSAGNRWLTIKNNTYEQLNDLVF